MIYFLVLNKFHCRFSGRIWFGSSGNCKCVGGFNPSDWWQAVLLFIGFDTDSRWRWGGQTPADISHGVKWEAIHLQVTGRRQEMVQRCQEIRWECSKLFLSCLNVKIEMWICCMYFKFRPYGVLDPFCLFQLKAVELCLRIKVQVLFLHKKKRLFWKSQTTTLSQYFTFNILTLTTHQYLSTENH